MDKSSQMGAKKYFGTSSSMRKCKADGCEVKFEPTFNSIQPTCSIKCAISHGRKLQQKQRDGEHKQRKKALRDTDRPWHIKTLQKIFNRFIRLRDAEYPCISCGRDNPPFFPRKGQWDAGHFRSVGGNPELRFEEKNCHKECVYCNTKDSEHLVKYQDNLAKIFGQERVDWLKGPHEAKHYTIPELKDLITHYRKKNKEMI